jgi:hypothetical protein
MTMTELDCVSDQVVAPLLALSPLQRHDLIGKLWDSLHDEKPVDLPQWKIDTLLASRAQYLAHPETASTWASLQSTFAQKYGWDLTQNA